MGRKVKLTITHSNCRSGFHKAGEEYVIEEDRTVCPPMCVELWHYAYPYVWALLNGAEDDRPDGSKGKETVILCPDQGRVHLRIDAVEDHKETTV